MGQLKCVKNRNLTVSLASKYSQTLLMEQSTATFPNIIRSLDKLKILLFWEILKTRNPLLLDGDYMPDKEYTDEEKEFVAQAWEIMYDSYFQLRNDGKSKFVLESAYEQMLLAHKIGQLQKNIDFCGYLEKHKEDLPEADYLRHKQGLIKNFVTIEPLIKVKYFEGLAENVEIVNKVISALHNKFNRHKEKNEKEIKEQVDNVYTVIARVSRITKMQINAQNMMVTEWLAYEQQAREIERAENEARTKKKK